MGSRALALGWALAGGRMPGQGVVTPSLAPALNWRLAITGAVTDSAGDTATQTAVQNSSANKRHAAIALSASQTRTLTIPIAAVVAPGGLAYASVNFGLTSTGVSNTGATASAQRSFDGGTTWSANLPIAQGVSQDRGQAFTLAAGAASLLRVTFVNGGTASTGRLGVFQRPASGRADIWTLEGPSFEDYGHHPDQWTDALQTAFPASDPIVFNQGKESTTTAQIRAQTVTDVPNFPLTDYWYVNQGGNTVTNTRPYSTGSSNAEVQAMAQDITTMIQAVTGAGKVPLVQGISFRAYTASPAVGDNVSPDNGSRPYDLSIVYPTLASVCPDQFDASLGVPRVDSYGFFLTNRAAILGGGDGTHPSSPTAYTSVRAYEASVMGAYVYGNSAWPVSLYEQAVSAAESAKTQTLKDKATELVAALPSSSAKTAFQNRITAIVTGAPGQVTGLALGTPTATTQPLSWTAPSGSPTSYTVEYRLSGASTWTAVTGVTGTTTSVSGLASSTAYDYRVSAVNASGTGTASSVATGTTAVASTTPPAVGDVILINAHDSRSTSDVKTTAPNWNDLDQKTYAATTLALINSAGGSTPLLAQITNGNMSAGNAGGGVPSPAGSGVFPDDVIKTSIFIDKSGAATFGTSTLGKVVISGVAAGTTWKVEVLTSRAAGSTRPVDINCTGQTTQTVDSNNNVSTLATFTGVTPSSGLIEASVTQNAAQNYGYLNAIRLTRTA